MTVTIRYGTTYRWIKCARQHLHIEDFFDTTQELQLASEFSAAEVNDADTALQFGAALGNGEATEDIGFADP